MNINIPPLDTHAMHEARARQDTLLKPRGALGQLEALSIRLAGMTRRLDWQPERRAVVVFAADHGVMAHQVSTVPPGVTAYMVGQFMAGWAAVNVLAQQMRARLTVVDAGVNADVAFTNTGAARFVAGKVAHGTADFTQSPALTPEQAERALRLGADVIAEEIRAGLDILVLGEMGIGNTASASALIAAIIGAPAGDVTGRGSGVDDATLTRKIALIRAALERHAPAQVDTLAKVGGLEIGALAGAMLYAASQRVPVVIDGLICTAAALIAHQINPDVTRYLIAGHRGAEPGHTVALEHLGLSPLLALDLRLGEGTGGLLALPLIEAAMRTLNEMGTLDIPNVG
jgi:nicotinate-nucleotide--dimethylbenzimidazole phosphoribosyltransferase